MSENLDNQTYVEEKMKELENYLVVIQCQQKEQKKANKYLMEKK